MSEAAGGFAFGSVDDGAHLEVIVEESESGDSTKDSSITEEHVQEAKAKYDSVARSAKREMLEMRELLEKLETGTATRAERERVGSLKSKLSMMKREVEATKHEATTAERKMLEESTHKKQIELDKAIKERGIRSVIRSVCASERVDLAFIVDCTASMTRYIESVKKSIKKIVKQVAKTNGNLKIRVAFICYRDLCDGSAQFEILDFVESTDTFEQFVSKLEAKGGGDAPEDMAGGIKKANSLSWEYPTRAAFLIADAPCHGRDFHSFSDDYPSGSPGVNIISELQKLTENPGNGSMSVYFGKITKHTDSMLNRFHKQGVMLQVVDMEDAASLAASVTTGIRKSIFKTMTLTGGSTRSIPYIRGSLELEAYKKRSAVSLKDYRILARRPSRLEWKNCDAVPVQVFRNKPITRMSDLQSPIGVGMLKKAPGRTDLVGVSTMHMRRAAEPFAEGQIRIAYHGQLSSRAGDLHLPKSEMILKAYKLVGGDMNDRDKYLKQMEVSNIVHFLASKYNKSSSRPKHCSTIQCLQNCVVEETSDKNERAGNRRYCAEAPLPIPAGAEFVKYSNNTGYWNDDEIDETLLKFTAYTYEVTGGYLMATDLQGIKRDGVFYLTDPVILCNDIMRFGDTNLGPAFMRKCIDSTRAYLEDNGWS